jgi:hypothetical protein
MNLVCVRQFIVMVVVVLSFKAWAGPRYLTRSGDGAAYGLRLEMDKVGDLLQIDVAELFKLVGAGSRKGTISGCHFPWTESLGESVSCNS